MLVDKIFGISFIELYFPSFLKHNGDAFLSHNLFRSSLTDITIFIFIISIEMITLI